MTKLSIAIGALLCLVGILSFTLAGFESPTALIPLYVGAPIALCAFLTEKYPAKRKIYMHIAVGLALVGFLVCLFKIAIKGELRNMNQASSIWTMCFLCFVLVGAYLQSFFKARMNKAD